MGGQSFKDKLSEYSEASGIVDDDLDQFMKDQKKRKVPPVVSKPESPIPETPDYLSVDAHEDEDPFGPECMICCTKVQRGMLELECGHSFHRRCLLPWVEAVPKNGERFLTGRARCPCCRGWAVAKSAKSEDVLKSINHHVRPIVDQFMKMCDLMLQNEEIDGKHREAIEEMKKAKKELPFMKEYVFYLCFDCGDVYFGGNKDCEQNHGEEDEEKDRADHICVKCVNKRCQTNYPTKCPKHGEAFIVFKCRFCCGIANFFCFGTTHFCESCHRKYPRHVVIPCPGEPTCAGHHVKNGTENENEQCLGCVLCRNNM